MITKVVLVICAAWLIAGLGFGLTLNHTEAIALIVASCAIPLGALWWEGR